MDSSLSISLSTTRANFLLTERKNSGVNIRDVDTFIAPTVFSSENLLAQDSVAAIKDRLIGFRIHSSNIHVSLPSEAMLIQQIPVEPSASNSEISELVSLEILQNCPGKSLSDFGIKYYSMMQKLDGSSFILVTLSEKTLEAQLQSLALSTGFLSMSIYPEFTSIHNTLYHSCPEIRQRNVVLFTINKNVVTTTALLQGELSYYNALIKNEDVEIDTLCESELLKIISSNTTFIDSIYLCGELLTASAIESIHSKTYGYVKNINRLETFHNCSSTLDKRRTEYCGRMAHAFATCLGNILPSIYSGVELASNTRLATQY
jgi:hypothetical protein